jgi:hypothetical protein
VVGELRRGILIGVVRREAEGVAVREQTLGDRASDARVRAGDKRDSLRPN